MSVNLKELIRKIIEYHGGEIIDRDDEFIWAKIDGNTEIYYVEDREVVDGEHVFKFNRDTEQVNAIKAIICVKGYTEMAENTAKKLKIYLIPRDKLASWIGEYVLDIYEKGETLNLFDEEDIEVEGIYYDEDEEEEEEVDEDVIPIIIEDVEGGDEKIMKVNITKEKAISISKKHIFGVDAELVLVPHFIFEFSLKLSIENVNDEKVVSGIVAVNALNGQYNIWKVGYETVSQIHIPHVKMEPRVSIEESEKNAIGFLMEEYTKEEEYTIEDENITIIDKRKITPLQDSIKTKFVGLHYLPVWIVRGRGRTVAINANSGEIKKVEDFGLTT